jgi:hypothetical protein
MDLLIHQYLPLASAGINIEAFHLPRYDDGRTLVLVRKRYILQMHL